MIIFKTTTKYYLILFLSSIYSLINYSAAQNIIIPKNYSYPIEFINSNTNHIFANNIKTVEFKQSVNNGFFPIININNSNSLLLTFDDLSAGVKNYQYKLLLCNADWKLSELDKFDYLEGFQTNYIHDYQTSMNTLLPYTHYMLQIPNDDIVLTKTGNYIIKVFKDNEDSIAFIRRFMIVNNQITINATAKRATNLEYSNTSQEIDFTLIDNNSLIRNPYEDLKVVILQNGRWDKTINNLKPKYIKDNELIYDFDSENVFRAGNEFRHFNCKNTRFTSENIEKIVYQKPYFLFKLQQDKKRVFKQYFTDTELNGYFKIDLENSDNPEIEADYVYVYFSIPFDTPLLDGNVFVLGAFNAWDKTKNNLMIYNYDKKEYQLKLLLKQGYYNYIYGYFDSNTKNTDSEIFEGNHYETENNYTILVYNYNLTYDYDELIGYKLINSREFE